MSAPETPSPFTEDVIAAIARHMNDDHVDDCLDIVRALGGVPDAVGARMTGMDPRGIVFAAVLADGAETDARVPWAEPVTERAQVRREVVVMSRRAREALGLEPHPEH